MDAQPTLLERLGLDKMKVNLTDDEIMANVERNVRRGLPQIHRHAENQETVLIVGGGWSLDDTFEELRDLHWRGAKIVALNGAMQWLIERNLRPSAMVMLDARPHNTRFIEAVPHCKYFLAGQCAPEAFDKAEALDLETYIWHAVSAGDTEKAFLDRFYLKQWTGVPWTNCVALRAVGLFRTLGFQKFHLFGVDSCYRDDGAHHAYAQPENEKEPTTNISVGGRRFRVSGWQAVQAMQFIGAVKDIADHGISLQMASHGDGLISHIIATGATRILEG